MVTTELLLDMLRQLAAERNALRRALAYIGRDLSPDGEDDHRKHHLDGQSKDHPGKEGTSLLSAPRR